MRRITPAVKKEWSEKAGYELSTNQVRFCEDAVNQGFPLREEKSDDDTEYLYFGYSGRFMYGKNCPALNVDYDDAIETRAKTHIDNMGLGYVIYARS